MTILEKNLSLLRLNKDSITLKKKVATDPTSHNFTFVVKADKGLLTARVIEKKNANAGGGNDELLLSYNSTTKYLTIQIFFLKEDTEGLSGTDYYYDILEEDATDINSGITHFMGSFTLIQTVQTPTDGSSLPADGTRFIGLNPADFETGELIWKTANGFEAITLTDLKTELGKLP